jgi:ferritin
MISESIQQAINKQIDLEFSSSHAYLAMAAYFENLNLSGFAHWFRVQSQEEVVHAMKFFNFLVDRGGRVDLGSVAAPQGEFSSPLEAAEHALGHERRVTAAINAIYALAAREEDFATTSFLKWFLDEQVEEEKNADELIQRLKLIAGDGTGLFLIDRDLAARPGEVIGAAAEAEAE